MTLPLEFKPPIEGRNVMSMVYYEDEPHFSDPQNLSDALRIAKRARHWRTLTDVEVRALRMIFEYDHPESESERQ